MSGRACKSAVDCTGFICEIEMAVHLIINGLISDPDAIDDFNEMKEKMEKRFEKWKAKHVDFDG